MFKLRRVSGESMLPTLRPDRIVVVRPTSAVRVGDVVVIRHGGREKVKRIKQINSGTIYVIGDNPAASTDSRHFGWIDQQFVQGKVIWPRNLEKRSYQK